MFIGALLGGRQPTVHGDGLQSRDFTYVDNVVQALEKAAITPGISGQVYNVGAGEGISVLTVLSELNPLLGTG
ncbi:MAG TPA: NAD-dependent epimerase/dehydratase family protein [Gemmataceae bacterium]|nr:NAD-dependent epimerase/dehydratase family protein [Gemmataceae bacterium]